MGRRSKAAQARRREKRSAYILQWQKVMKGRASNDNAGYSGADRRSGDAGWRGQGDK